MNKKIHLAIDVGGTNTRLVFQKIVSGEIIETSAIYKEKIAKLEDLRDFILTSLTGKDVENVDHCIIGIAGNIIAGNRVTITNWPGQPLLTLDLLHSWGLPNTTKLVNDMEPAAYGVIALQEDDRLLKQFATQIFQPKAEYIVDTNPKHKVILAPGTGFGTVNAIDTEDGSFTIIPSEVQHIFASPLDSKHQKLIEVFQKENKRYPSWEDFVSGRGLVFTYKALIDNFYPQHKSLISNNETEDLAGLIALKAASEEVCFETMDIFYRCVGKLAQAIALIVQPFGGIFLCGGNTAKNEEMIIKSRILEELQTNHLRQEQLEQFPVYLVKDEDINLRGALWACN